MDDIYKFIITEPYQIYYNNGFGIYSCKTKDRIPNKKFDTITIVGNLHELDEGLSYEIQAKLVQDVRYGWQYKVETGARVIKPTTYKQQKNYLTSLMSISQAEEILKHYPNIVDQVINDDFDIDYSLTYGIKEKKWKSIKNKIKDNFVLSELLVFLSPYGISYKQVQRILSKHKDPHFLKREINKNPYFLTQFRGFGFKTVDKIALKINPDSIYSPQRLQSFIIYYLQQIGQDNGHTYITMKELVQQVKKNIPECISILVDFIKRHQDSSDILYFNKDNLGLKVYYDKEMYCINKIKNIQSSNIEKSFLSDKIIEKTIEETNKEQGFEFTKEQKDAIIEMSKHNFSVLTAKAGCGKSVTTRGILNTFKKSELSIACCAFTAKAAKRITEATGFHAQTIHRMLQSDQAGKFLYNEENKLFYDVVLLDEAGMVSVHLLYSLLKAIDHTKTKFIMVGDDRQLKPIGYGDIFSDIIMRDKEFNIIRLNKVMRQANDSGILTDANKIREGINPIVSIKPTVVHGNKKDNIYIFRDNKEDLNNIAINLYMKIVKDNNNSVDDVVIMTPTRQNGVNCSNSINIKIQDLVLPNVEDHIIVYGTKYKLGAKVMQIVNNKDLGVYNGDTGYITEIKNFKNEVYCIVNYGNSIGEIKYKSIDFDQLSLAYALTVHKLQGSGIKNTIAIYDTSHRIMLNNTLAYTAMTRSEEKNITLLMPQTLKWLLDKDDSYRNTWAKIE